MKDKLNLILKKYVDIFFKEYMTFLNKEQLEILKNIDYKSIIHYDNLSYPLGMVSLNQIYLSNNVDNLVETMKTMPDYGKTNNFVNNKNYTSYLKNTYENGYDVIDYYSDQLIYLVFKLVIKNTNGFIDGLINYEVNYLANKYNFKFANLYKREEIIANKIVEIIGHNNSTKILFMDKPSSFRYLSENLGYRYAQLYENIIMLIENNYQTLLKGNYYGFNGFITYAKDYDNLEYGDAYNCLLEFEAKNNFNM